MFEGRLIRIDELPYADAIRGYFAKHVIATHYFAADAALEALAGARAGRAAVDRRSGRRQGVARRRRGAGGRGRPAGRGADRPAARPASRPRPTARAAITSRGGEVTLAQGLVKAPAPPSAGAGTARPARRAARRAGRSWCASPPRAGRPRSTSWATSIAPSRSATRARPSRPTSSELAATDGALVVRAPGAAERRLAAGDIAAVHTMAPVVIPDGRLPAGRRRSPARSRWRASSSRWCW